MGRTRIELLSSGDIDMFDDVATPLTFAVADVRTPDKRDSHFSKTIKIPATKGNNLRFGHIFDINLSDGTYNPNRKAPCTLYIDDTAQLNGFLQILSIEIDDKNDIIYNCSIKGNVNNIFQELGDSELTDLDFSSFDHTLNRVNQKASWTNTHVQGYCYPLIDYGFDSNINHYKVEHLMPAIFLRTYVDKIFSYAGFTYTSSFFDTTHFKNLIIPCIGDGFKYSATQINARLFEASRSSTQNVPLTYSAGNPSSWEQLSFNTDVTDPANAFNTSTSKWTVPVTGFYNLQVDANLNTSGTITNPGWAAPGTYTLVHTLLGIRKQDSITLNQTIISSQYWQIDSPSSTKTTSATNIYLIAGDVMEAVITSFYNVGGTTIQLQFNSSGSKFFCSVANNSLQAGDTVTMNNTLPTKVKQKDLLLDIIRMFNLYVEVDKNDNKKLNIETRDDFYTSGTIRDWTYKLDNSKPLELTPMGELDYKIFKYNYKDDKDYYNKKYSENYSIGYGNRTYEVENDFLKSERTTSIMFSPTPLVAPVGDDRVIPKIWEVDSSNVIKNKPFNIRILYKGATITTLYPYQYEDSTVSITTENQFLYAGHLDSVTAPTFDLSFGVPKELYYQTNIYTNANLFNLYHKKYLDEITDPDSKIVVGYFYLTPKDIAQLDFRDTYYFETQYFRLNKIYDYNPIDESVTKCEFIKIKEGRSFTALSKTVSGGYPTPYTGPEDRADSTPIIASGVSTGSPRSVIVLGGNNTISGQLRNSYINGSYNYIHGGDNINLFGSSGNTIYDNLSNVTLINTSGTVVSESNSLYVNGFAITSGTIASLSNGWSDVSYNSTDYFSNSGSWSVLSGDVDVNRYILIGKSLTWNVVVTGTISPTVSTVYIKTPNGYTIKSTLLNNIPYAFIAGSSYSATMGASVGNNYLGVAKIDGSNFGAGSTTIGFTITLEIE